MKMKLNNNGYWEINRGKTKIVVYPGSDRPYKPVSFTYNTDPPYTSRVGLLEIGRAVRSLYTEEQLFEYFCSIAEQSKFIKRYKYVLNLLQRKGI